MSRLLRRADDFLGDFDRQFQWYLVEAGETVARLGSKAGVTGNVGPKAFRTLNAADIKVYLSNEGTVADAIRKFKAGELKETTAANVNGHWA
jgi:predicted Fe-Mo cluster-binding NifX family protein